VNQVKSVALLNGFITANLPLIQGEYGLTPSEAAWLPAAYVMANVSSNLILFKAHPLNQLQPAQIRPFHKYAQKYAIPELQ
jgi:hypothetical protein